MSYIEVDNFVDFDTYNDGSPFRVIQDYYSDIVFNNPTEYHLYKTKIHSDGGTRYFIILTYNTNNKLFTKKFMDKMCIVDISCHLDNVSITNKTIISEAIISIMEIDTKCTLVYNIFNAIETDITFMDRFNIPTDKRIFFFCYNYDKFIEKVSPDFYKDPLFKICMDMMKPKNTSDNPEDLFKKLNDKLDKLYERCENIEKRLNCHINYNNDESLDTVSNIHDEIKSYTTLVNNDDLSPTSVSWGLCSKPYIEGDEKSYR